MRISSIGVVALCGVASWAEAAPSEAGAPAVTARTNSNTAYLSYSPPEEQCIAADELLSAVQAHIGRNPFTREPAGVVIDVKLERVGQPARWHAVLQVGDGQSQIWGDREVLSENEDCRTLDSPLTLILALIVDSELMQPPSAQQAPQAEPSSTPEESRFDEEPAPPPKPSRPPPPWQAEWDWLANVERGVLPNLAWGTEMSLLVRPPYVPDFRFYLGGFMPQQQRVSSNASLQFLHARAGLQLCSSLAHWGALRFDGCAGVAVGLLQVEGEGLTPSRSVTRQLAESALTARAALALTRTLSVVTRGSLVFPWKTDRFVYSQPGGQVSEAHEISPFVFDIGIGMGLRFH
ncbi:MAG TPA: hypothetical protein VHO25_09420 [Polyangiaceae bacterium]|nr:hypothetical protein [Polyangiaceae bacterium]